jgi:hypothetical protein
VLDGVGSDTAKPMEHPHSVPAGDWGGLQGSAIYTAGVGECRGLLTGPPGEAQDMMREAGDGSGGTGRSVPEGLAEARDGELWGSEGSAAVDTAGEHARTGMHAGGPTPIETTTVSMVVQDEGPDRGIRSHETARGECTVQHARDMSTQEDRLMWSGQQGSGGIGTGGWGEVDALLREGSPIRSPSVGIGTTSMSELHSTDCHGRESGGGALPKVGLKEKPKSRKADELGRVSRRRRQAAEPGGRLGAEEESRWLTWMADDRGREQQRDALDAGLSRGEAGAAGEDAEQRRKRRDMVVKEEEGGRLVP